MVIYNNIKVIGMKYTEEILQLARKIAHDGDSVSNKEKEFQVEILMGMVKEQLNDYLEGK